MKFLTYIRVYLITFDPISFTLDSRLNILNRNIRLCSAVSDEFNVSLNSHRRGVAGFSFFFFINVNVGDNAIQVRKNLF